MVTDIGYKDRSDIVWQSLDHIYGYEDTMYTGAFINASLNIDVRQNHSVSKTPRTTHNKSIDSAKTTHSITDETLARHLQQQENREYARAIQRSCKNTTKKKTSTFTNRILTNFAINRLCAII